jgi:hypothetical protein
VIGYRTSNLFLLAFVLIIAFLSFIKLLSFSVLDILAYALLLFGISFFYSAYNKQNKVGIVLSSVVFFVGTIIFVFAQFEIWNFGTVFVPSALFMIGTSLLIANLLTKTDSTSIIFSILSLLAGIWLLVMRGTASIDLYLSAVYSLAKTYGVIVLILAGAIFFAAIMVKKNNNDRN